MDQYACTADQFKNAFCYGTKQLALHREHLNMLNILPVPNGNTGDNLHKTLLSSLQEMKDDKHFGNLAHQCARGALFGASGSSGIILANFLIGFSETVGDSEKASIDELLRAIVRGCLKVKSAIGESADGGIFEIGAAMYDGLSGWNPEKRTLTEIVSLIRDIAVRALESMPSKNALCSKAGVNDAGALGLFYFIDGLYRYSAAMPLEQCGSESCIPSLPEDISVKGVLYSVEFLLTNVTMPIEEIKKSLSDIGNPILLAYEKGDTVKVLIRTTDPKRVFDRSARFGKSTKIRVDDLIDEQRYFLSKAQNKETI